MRYARGSCGVVNEGDEGGTVRVRAFDDAGKEYGPVTLAIEAGEVRHFNSDDLERGNAAKGLTGSTGPPTAPAGQRRWRLAFESDLAIRVLGYVRVRGAEENGVHAYEVAFFNPGSNLGAASVLRVVNRSESEAMVTITGMDDAGEAGEDEVRLRIPPGRRACSGRRRWSRAMTRSRTTRRSKARSATGRASGGFE